MLRTRLAEAATRATRCSPDPLNAATRRLGVSRIVNQRFLTPFPLHLFRFETAVYLLEHRDGLKSAVVMSGALTSEFAFAARIKGRAEPVSTWIRLQNQRPFGHFAQQLRAIEETIHTGRAVYPLERTLLTTGTLDRLMHSLAQNGKRFETPELAIAYQPTDWPFANHPKTQLKLPDPE